MDTLAHAMIGAAICSKTGLAGGRTGPVNRQGNPTVFHWTLPTAFAFGLLPDMLSLGWFLVWQHIQHGHLVWRGIPDYIFTLYNITHSLLVIALLMLIIRLVFPKLLLPALAWPLHVITDIFSHGEGRFSTPILWPLSDLRIYGINWWQHPWITRVTWLIFVTLWSVMLIYRYRYVRMHRTATDVNKR